MLARLLGLNVRALRIFGSTALCLAWVAAGRASVFQHAQRALPWQGPSSAPAPPQGAPGPAALGGSALPGRGRPTGHPATASSARASRLQTCRRCHRLRPRRPSTRACTSATALSSGTGAQATRSSARPAESSCGMAVTRSKRAHSTSTAPAASARARPRSPPCCNVSSSPRDVSQGRWPLSPSALFSVQSGHVGTRRDGHRASSRR